MILLGIFSSAASFFLIAQATTTTEIFLSGFYMDRSIKIV